MRRRIYLMEGKVDSTSESYAVAKIAGIELMPFYFTTLARKRIFTFRAPTNYIW